MENMFFSDWQSVLRALIMTSLGYFALVIVLRISGKRTLSKMNAFDFLVTVALGSCLASVSLNKNIAIAEGIVVYLTLIGLQFVLTFLTVRFKPVKGIVSGEPVLLVYDGKPLEKVMKEQRITMEELYFSARSSNILQIESVEFAILETIGDITIIAKSHDSQNKSETLKNVIGYSSTM